MLRRRSEGSFFLFECNGPLAQPAGDCLDAMGRRRSQDPQNRYKVLLNPFK